jgi:hypothetical protein
MNGAFFIYYTIILKIKLLTMRKIYLTFTAFIFLLTSKAQVNTLAEGFEVVTANSVTPVTGWTAKNNSAGAPGERWFAGSGFSTPFLQAGAPHGGTDCIATNYACGSGGTGVTLSNWLISPVLNLANGAQFRFWTLGADDAAGTAQEYADNLQVRMSTGSGVDVGTTSTSVGTFTTQLLEINPGLTTTGYPITWTAFTVTVSGLGSPTTGRIALRYFVTDGGLNGNNSDAILIDDVAYNIAGLPVTLTQFGGMKEGMINKLFWVTSTEVNNNGFELQRSADGSNFSKLSFITSKSDNGTSNIVLNYNYIDENPLRGVNYYRLKQIDKDGRFTFSTIITIKAPKATTLAFINLYPNPVSDEAALIIMSPSIQKINIVITDLSGKRMMQQSNLVQEGDNNIRLATTNLASGTYFLKAVSDDGSQSILQKFIKH